MSEKDTLETAITRLIKQRVYVESPEDAPADVEVNEGPQGGLWYEGDETGGGGDESGDDAVGSTAFGETDFTRLNDHGVLHDEEQAKLKDHLASHHGEDVVEDVYDEYGWMYEWKAHRESAEGVKLGIAHARALGMDEENVKGYDDEYAEAVTEDHVALVEDMHEAGKQWFRETFGDTAQMNRGFKDGGGRMLESLFTDESDTVALDGNEMDNWSWEMDIPREWGRQRSDGIGAITRTNRDIDEFVMSIDGIAGEYVNYNDSAVTFDGETEVAKENVSIEGSSAVKDYDDDGNWDYDWIRYEGSFFPHRPLAEQDIDAVKMMALELEDNMLTIGHGIDDDAADRMTDMVENIRDHLEAELDPEDSEDAQVIEAANNAIDEAERWL